MRRALLLLCLLGGAACAKGAGSSHEHLGLHQQHFTSDRAVLLDFTIEGRLVAATDDRSALSTLIEAQLLYAVGVLNADASVGRYERLEIDGIRTTPTDAGDRFEVTYEAKLPVAWGLEGEPPRKYSLTLPADVSWDAQTAFAAKYGSTCVDPHGGAVNAGRMFLFYRPDNPGCVFAPEDVVTVGAKVTVSAENTTGMYPEYARVWEDDVLRVVAMFSRAQPGDVPYDEGALAFGDFVGRAYASLRRWAPEDAELEEPVLPDSSDPLPHVELNARLRDGRRVVVDAALVGYRVADDGSAFSTWYDARTPEADLIAYGGHAGLGENVRALMGKGTFRPGKYLIWMVNGCDTFAYVDRTLAERRAPLNPDDPTGTKHMDVVSNVLAAYFDTTADTTIAFVDALFTGGDPALAPPATYQAIFTSLDPAQVTVVTGEEDNVFRPGDIPPRSVSTATSTSTSERTVTVTPPKFLPGSTVEGNDDGSSSRSCAATPRAEGTGRFGLVVALAALVVARRRACAERTSGERRFGTTT